MVNIEIQADAQKDQSPARERSIFAIGWVRFKSTTDTAIQTKDEMNVLGVMVVQDSVETRQTQKDMDR